MDPGRVRDLNYDQIDHVDTTKSETLVVRQDVGSGFWQGGHHVHVIMLPGSCGAWQDEETERSFAPIADAILFHLGPSELPTTRVTALDVAQTFVQRVRSSRIKDKKSSRVRLSGGRGCGRSGQHDGAVVPMPSMPWQASARCPMRLPNLVELYSVWSRLVCPQGSPSSLALKLMAEELMNASRPLDR